MTDQLSLLPMLNELPEGNQGTIEALQESVRQNRKGDKVMKCDELKRFDIVGKYRDEETMLEFRTDGECYDADDVDAAIAELKDENRKLKRALWISRAKAYRYIAELIACFNPDYVRNRKMFTPNNLKQKQMNSLKWARLMLKIERKCRAKAEEYK